MSIRWDYLHARAELLTRLRAFFQGRGFLEVETPTLLSEIIPERHIVPFAMSHVATQHTASQGNPLYLQASPELAMKRLLAAGSGAIFQVCKAFRAEEQGALHNREFTMVEWYRPGDDARAGMELLEELTYTLTGLSCRRTTYREAFTRTLGIDPHTASLDELRAATDHPPELGAERDEWLNDLLATQIEKTLGADQPEILCDYPASQAALATTTEDDHGALVAERFELYWRGVELANGYHELADSAELRRRLTAANEQILAQGRPALPLPESLFSLMESPGLPSCAGVALGFDRLVMLCVGAETIHEVRCE